MNNSARKIGVLEPAHSLIKRAGGEAEVAKALGLSPITVYKWQYPKKDGGTGGLVPTTYHQRILDWGNDQGIGLEHKDFFCAA